MTELENVWTNEVLELWTIRATEVKCWGESITHAAYMEMEDILLLITKVLLSNHLRRASEGNIFYNDGECKHLELWKCRNTYS